MQAAVEPHNATVEVTTSITLLCLANGFEVDSVSYAWEVSQVGGGVRPLNVTSSHLLLNNVTTSAAYRCTVTKSNGTMAVSEFSYVTVVGKCVCDKPGKILNSLFPP